MDTMIYDFKTKINKIKDNMKFKVREQDVATDADSYQLCVDG